MRVHQPFLAAIALGTLLAACGGSASAPATSAPATSPSGASQVVAKPASVSAAPASAAGATGGAKLTGAGSTFDFPLFSKVFDAYQKDAGTHVNYQSVGSGAGIEQLTKKTVDFGASDAIMTDEQEK